MGECFSSESNSEHEIKKQEKKYVYEDHNVKFEKIFTKEACKGEINERVEKNIFIKNPNISYLEATKMYPRLAEGE